MGRSDMGMDATSQIFYGYKDPIDYLGILDEDGYLSDDYNEDSYSIVSGAGYDRKFLTIAKSNRYFDWDYGIQPVDPYEMCRETENDNYFQLVRSFFQKNNFEYDSNKIGWFVVCDYS